MAGYNIAPWSKLRVTSKPGTFVSSVVTPDFFCFASYLQSILVPWNIQIFIQSGEFFYPCTVHSDIHGVSQKT